MEKNSYDGETCDLRSPRHNSDYSTTSNPDVLPSSMWRGIKCHWICTRWKRPKSKTHTGPSYNVANENPNVKKKYVTHQSQRAYGCCCIRAVPTNEMHKVIKFRCTRCVYWVLSCLHMDARLRTSIQSDIKRLQANKRTKGKEREAKEAEKKEKKIGGAHNGILYNV